ncbi:MAG: TetR/AcrR family transcriptional regulator [Polyangiales bacterium]
MKPAPTRTTAAPRWKAPAKPKRRAAAGSAPRAAPRRAQGRPADAEDAVGRDALIRAARELLEELPPAKVTRAAVARHAGVDPSLIRYYFKDRASLLLAVFEWVIAKHDGARASKPAASAADCLRDYVRGFFQFHAENPFFHRLLLEEIAVSELPSARKAFHRINHAALGQLGKVFAAGSKDGTLRGVDPVLMHIVVIGLCEFFFSSRVLLEDALGKNAAPEQLADRYADLITNMVLDGLARR